MKAGNRDRRVTFERRMVTTDDYGGETEEWIEYYKAWANVSFGTGAERREAAQELASAPATFRVLWNSKTKLLSVTDRINYLDALWDILSVVPLGLNEGVEITATRTLT
jgi:SPP1 family predicted phage head-tail adaptor